MVPQLRVIIVSSTALFFPNNRGKVNTIKGENNPSHTFKDQHSKIG